MSDPNFPQPNQPGPQFPQTPAPQFAAGQGAAPLPAPQEPESSKSFVATWLLSYFLGVLGVDRFYLGKVGTGIAKLLTLGGLGIWALVDLILVLAGAQRDKHGLKLAGYDAHKKLAWIITGVLVLIGAVGGSQVPGAVQTQPLVADTVIAEVG